MVWGAGISKCDTELGEGRREGEHGGVEAGSLWRGLVLQCLCGAGESESLSTSCEV